MLGRPLVEAHALAIPTNRISDSAIPIFHNQRAVAPQLLPAPLQGTTEPEKEKVRAKGKVRVEERAKAKAEERAKVEEKAKVEDRAKPVEYVSGCRSASFNPV